MQCIPVVFMLLQVIDLKLHKKVRIHLFWHDVRTAVTLHRLDRVALEHPGACREPGLIVATKVLGESFRVFWVNQHLPFGGGRGVALAAR